MKKMLVCLILVTGVLTSCSVKNPPETEVDNNTQIENVQESKGIVDNVKDYILNEQEEVAEANKLNWSKAFLEEVDVNSLYEKYVAEDGDINSVSDFAKYITLNAPIKDDWEELFKADFAKAYDDEIVKIEALEEEEEDEDLYQVYVSKDGQDVPFVTVSARTGYFHG